MASSVSASTCVDAGEWGGVAPSYSASREGDRGGVREHDVAPSYSASHEGDRDGVRERDVAGVESLASPEGDRGEESRPGDAAAEESSSVSSSGSA